MPEHIHKEIVAPNETSHLVKIREEVKSIASRSNFNETDVGRIVLAVDEAVANIMEHAYEDCDEGGDITISIDADGRRLEVIVADSGKEFDPNTIEVPDMIEHVSKGKKKGLGIFLMRQIMDEVKYTFVQGVRNELRMVKYVTAPEGDH